MGYSCTEKSKYQAWNRGFSFSLAWRATVSTALVYNYWRHCWQQSTPCGLGADQRHHFSLVSLHTCLYCSAHRLATDLREERKSGQVFMCTEVGWKNDVMQNCGWDLITSSKLSNTSESFSFDTLDSFANSDLMHAPQVFFHVVL